MTTSDEVRRADQKYNDALTDLDRAVVALSDRPTLGRDDATRVASALMVFLQQITAFVESKDREIAASSGARMTALEHQLEAIAELRTQVAVVHRATQALTRLQSSVESLQSQVGRKSAAVSQTDDDGRRTTDDGRRTTADGRRPTTPDHIYVAFEDQFRGSDDDVADKLRAYVPIFSAAGDALVVDLGCGRGELLNALAAAGIRARGVDANADMAAIARERGLDAVAGDALAFLDGQDDGSLGGVVATQVVEHLEPSYLMRLLDAAARKLRAGAPIVIETINPACWLAFFSSYIRDLTHVRPVHPETLQYLLRAAGFERVELRYSAPVPEAVKMKTVDLPQEILAGSDPTAAALKAVAHGINANAAILNNLMFTHLDYAAIGFKS